MKRFLVLFLACLASGRAAVAYADQNQVKVGDSEQKVADTLGTPADIRPVAGHTNEHFLIFIQDGGSHACVLLMKDEAVRAINCGMNGVVNGKDQMAGVVVANDAADEVAQKPVENTAAERQDESPFHLQLDLVGVSYDVTWQEMSLQSSDNPNATPGYLNVTNRYVRTAPEEFNLGISFGNWRTYLNLMNTGTNSSDVQDSAFSTLAIAYALSDYVDVGVFGDLGYNYATAQNTSSSASLQGSSYAFGPHIKATVPLTSAVSLETTADAGIDFRNLTYRSSTVTLDGSNTGFFGYFQVLLAADVYKHLSYLLWVDTWMSLGTLTGSETDSGQTFTGSLNYDIYRLRVVPLGLRIKF